MALFSFAPLQFKTLSDLSALEVSPDLLVVLSPPVPPEPPDPPDQLLSLVRHLLCDFSISPPLALTLFVDLTVAHSASSVSLSGPLRLVVVCVTDFFTAACSFLSEFSLALSCPSKLAVDPLRYIHQISLICVYSLVGFIKSLGMLFGWVSESLLWTIELVFALVIVVLQICVVNLPCYLNSSGILIKYMALVTYVLGSFILTFMVSDGFFVALMQSLTAVCRVWSVCALTVVALMLFSPHLWQIGMRNYITCLPLVNWIRLGFHSLVYSFMELILLPDLSLVSSENVAGSFASKEVLRFFSSLMGLYSDAQD